MAVAVCYETPTLFSRYTVTDAVAIPKGTILALTSENYASAATADNDVVAGVAWMEKVASDGSTEVTAARDGMWGITAGSAANITVGNDVVVHQLNEVTVYTSLDDEKGYVLGKSMETYASSAPAVIKVRVNV